MLLFKVLFACIGFTLGSTTAAATSSSSSGLLPKPTGPFHVGRRVAELIDYSRTQPFAPDVEPRRLMISIFYPVSRHCSYFPEAYFPPETAAVEDGELSDYGLAAPNGTFEALALHIATAGPNQTGKHHGGPKSNSLVMFMPAQGTTRLFYSQIASEIASKGYTVVTIDAPYDVDVVQYPDGAIVGINETVWGSNNVTALAQTAYIAIETRVEDVSFVLDQLSNTTLAHSLVPNLPSSGLNTTHTVMFGHSLGGATAYSILQADDRVLGGLNVDGGLYGPGLTNGTSKPFMFMAHANHTRGNPADDPELTWQQAWPHITGWKKDMIVADTLHYDFSDFPTVFETLGITPTNVTIAVGLQVGSLRGTRALHIVTSYVHAFLDFVLHGKNSKLLDGPVGEFPEVTFEY